MSVLKPDSNELDSTSKVILLEAIMFANEAENIKLSKQLEFTKRAINILNQRIRKLDEEKEENELFYQEAMNELSLRRTNEINSLQDQLQQAARRQEEGKDRNEFKREIYAEINKVKADLENQMRSCNTKVENYKITIQQLRKQLPTSQKNLTNSQLLKQLKEKDSRILLMGTNSKRIITKMNQKLMIRDEKIRKLNEENCNKAKRIKSLEEELSEYSLDLNENFDNGELNDAFVSEVKPAYDNSNDPINTKLNEDNEEVFVKDDINDFTYLGQTINQNHTPEQLNMKQSANMHEAVSCST